MQSPEVQQFIQSCKEKGLNVTFQRITIYKKLTEFQGHPTVEDIYKSVKIDHPTISMATVYKTLETLSSHNLINKVSHFHDHAIYDSNNQLHHHLVCLKCKRIVDIENNQLDTLTLPAEIGSDFQILGYRVEIEGICKSCSSHN